VWIQEIKAGMVSPASLRESQPFRQSVLVHVMVLVEPVEGVLAQPVKDRHKELPVSCMQKDAEGVSAQTGERQHFAGIHRQM